MTPLVGLGIGFITDLVSKYGEKLAVKGIEKVTGMDLSKQEITPEIQQMLLDNEVKIRALDFEKMKLELDTTKEENRHNEKYIEVEIGDKQNARGSDHLAPLQTDIAKEVYSQTKWQIPLLLIMNILLVIISKQLNLDEVVIVAVGNLLGISLNNAYRERQSLLEFLFGSSVGSKIKDKN